MVGIISASSLLVIPKLKESERILNIVSKKMFVLENGIFLK